MTPAKAVERVRELVTVGHRDPPRGEGWLLSLGMRLYLDDGGSQRNPKKPIFVLAGWITSRDYWAQLAWNWEMIRRVRKAPIYHATDAEFPPHREFKKWVADCQTDNDAKRRLIGLKQDFAKIIDENRLAGVGRGVHIPDYNERVLHADWIARKTPRERFLPVCQCLSLCLEWIGADWPHRPKGEDISVVLQEGTYGLGEAVDYFWWLKRQEKPFWMKPFVMISIGPKELPPLQAADMLAFEAYKANERFFLHDPPLPERQLLKLLCKRRRVSFKYGDRRTFDAMAERYRPWIEAEKRGRQ